MEEAYAFVGGGVLSMESVDVSRDVQELRLRRTRKGKGHGVEACLVSGKCQIEGDRILTLYRGTVEIWREGLELQRRWRGETP